MTKEDLAELLCLELAANRIENHDDFVKLSATIKDGDFQKLGTLLANDFDNATENDVKFAARIITYVTQSVAEQVTSQIDLIKQFTGGQIVLPATKRLIWLAVQQLDRVGAIFGGNITSRGKFLEIFYASYLLNVFPGVIVPNATNGVDVYVVETQTINGETVWVTENDKYLKGEDTVKAARNLLHNLNPNTKAGNHWSPVPKVKKRIELKSPGLASTSYDDIWNKSVEFGWQQILRIINGEYDEKDEVCLIFPWKSAQDKALFFLSNSEGTEHLDKLSAVLRQEAKMYKFIRLIKPAKDGEDFVANLDEVMNSLDDLSQMDISTNRNAFKVKLWKFDGRNWYGKDFNDEWYARETKSFSRDNTDAQQISLFNAKELSEREFYVLADVFKQKIIKYLATDAYWWLNKLLKKIVGKRREEDKYYTVKKVFLNVDINKTVWRFGRKEERELVESKFNTLLETWMELCVSNLGVKITVEEIKTAMLDIDSMLDLLPETGDYLAQSWSENNKEIDLGLKYAAKAKIKTKNKKNTL